MAGDGAKKPNKNSRPPTGKVSFSTVALAVGVLMVLFGLWQLAERFLGPWLHGIWQVISLVISIVWPLLIIASGVGLMILARKGNLSLPVDRKLYRSLRNKKIGGICGGVGEYLGVDPVVVRIITIVLAIPFWYFIPPLYLLFWIFIEPDTKNYNNWV